MNTKEYLSQIYYIEKMIYAKEEQVQQLKDLVEKTTLTYSNDKVSMSHGKNKKEDYMVQCLDLEKEIQQDISLLIEKKQTITKAIEKVEDPKYKLLLTLRYLNYKKWEDIAEYMEYQDVRWIYTLHKKSLQFIENHVLPVV